MRIGFLGGGSMGGALMQGIMRARQPLFSCVKVFDPAQEVCGRLKAEGIEIAPSARELFEGCDITVLAVKPQVLESAVKPYADALSGKLVISIAAGWTRAELCALLPADTHVLRAMPNTPALVGRGMAVLCNAPELSGAERRAAEALFGCVGEYLWLDEGSMDAVTGVSGSGAAYAYMFIDAMACGGVRMGLKRDAALMLAAQTVMGAAEMILSTGKHPEELKDAVCSPAGTTIEAVRLLERRGMRSAVMDAVICCAEKARDMASAK